MIRGIIFDFDGTLIDSYDAIAECLNHVRSSFSLPPYPVEDVRPMVGHGLEHLIAEAIGPGRVEEGVRLFPRGVAVEGAYVAFYALAFFVLRWWRMTSRRRSQRFSIAPLLGAGFWAAVLWLLLRPQHVPGDGMGIVVLVLTAAVVQLVSPWEEPPPVPARRVRLRHA